MSALDDLLPIRRILVDGVKIPFARDLNVDSSTLTATLSEDGKMLTLSASGGGGGSPEDVDPTPDTLLLRGPSGEAKATEVLTSAINRATSGALAIGDDVATTNVTVGVPTTAGVGLAGSYIEIVAANEMVIDSGGDGISIAPSGTCDYVNTGHTACAVSLTCSTYLVTAATTHREVANTSITHDTPTIIERTAAGVTMFTRTIAAAFALLWAAAVTSIEETWAQATSGAGGAWWRRGQKGAPGSIGGVVGLASGKGGNPGTNLAGGIRLELGQQAGGTTDYLGIYEDSTQFLGIRRIGTYAYIDSAAGLNLTGTEVGFVASARTTQPLRVTSSHTAEDSAGWDVTLDASGATARVRVTGAAATTVTWEAYITVRSGKAA